MTEQQWLATDNPELMLAYLIFSGNHLSSRKLDLWRKSYLGIYDLAKRAAMLREVRGNPFRSVTLCGTVLAWNDRTVPRLAEAIYEGRRFEELPILADALEESGCENEELLRHCRGEERLPVYAQDSLTRQDVYFGSQWQPLRGPHVCGCWAVDLLLGKE